MFQNYELLSRAQSSGTNNRGYYQTVSQESADYNAQVSTPNVQALMNAVGTNFHSSPVYGNTPVNSPAVHISQPGVLQVALFLSNVIVTRLQNYQQARQVIGSSTSQTVHPQLTIGYYPSSTIGPVPNGTSYQYAQPVLPKYTPTPLTHPNMAYQCLSPIEVYHPTTPQVQALYQGQVHSVNSFPAIDQSHAEFTHVNQQNLYPSNFAPTGYAEQIQPNQFPVQQRGETSLSDLYYPCDQSSFAYYQDTTASLGIVDRESISGKLKQSPSHFFSDDEDDGITVVIRPLRHPVLPQVREEEVVSTLVATSSSSSVLDKDPSPRSDQSQVVSM